MQIRAGLLSSLLILGLCSVASAEEASPAAKSTTTIDSVAGQHNKTPGADIDETITNNYLRALSGSKSRWSVASQFLYMGGTVTNAFGGQRPNIAAGAAIPTAAMLEGQVSAKYNISSQHSIMAGTGLDWVTPFQGSSTPSDYNRKVDVYNPYLIYQYLYKWNGVQSALQFQPTFYTQTSTVNQGYTVNLQLAQNNVYEVGKSGLFLGLYAAIYDNPYFAKDGMQLMNGQMTNLNAVQADYGLSLDPFAEYQLNEMFNLRTVFNFWNYDHWRGNPNAPLQASTGAAFAKEPWTQSVGVGIKITRDVFLYPNVQFLPEKTRADLTNVALNSVINLF